MFGDAGLESLALTLGQRGAVVGGRLDREGLAGGVESLDGIDPGATDAERLLDLPGGPALGVEFDHAKSEFDRIRLHDRALLDSVIPDPNSTR